MSIDFTKVPFEEAIQYFKGKVNLPTKTWTDIWQGMHSRAFVVAGATKNELLSDFRTAIDKAISEGTTIEDFRKTFDETVARNGWSYNGERGWRTGVIFNTNMRVAYAAGNYKQMMDNRKERPLWRYIGGLSESPRPLHLSWSGTTLPADDPWWDTHYPPNDWGCKCEVVSQTQDEIDEMKKEGVAISTERPNDGTYQWTDKEGNTHTIPNGIGPGWAYNPGKTAWGENEALRQMEDQGPWRDLNPWGPEKYGRPDIEVDNPVAGLGDVVGNGDEAGLRNALRKAIGGDDAGVVDPAGNTVMVTQAIVDHILQKPATRWDGREAYFPFIRELIEKPYEIWIGFAQSETSGRVGIRMKYVKAIRLEKNRVLGLYAEFMNGQWVSQDLFRGGLTGAGNLRKGRLLYGRD